MIGPYAENLAFVTPKEHSQLLEEAFQRDDVDWSVPLDDVRRMARDAEFAEAQRLEIRLSYRRVFVLISAGVMFNRGVVEERTISRPSYEPPAAQTQGDILPATTIRNAVRTPRNDPCPCGSGKKYKKCCLNN